MGSIRHVDEGQRGPGGIPRPGPHLVTEWSTSDPGVARTLQLIAGLPAHSAARLELEGVLHMFQARLAFQDAARARDREVRRRG